MLLDDMILESLDSTPCVSLLHRFALSHLLLQKNMLSEKKLDKIPIHMKTIDVL